MSPTLHRVARLDELSATRGKRVCIKSDKETPVLLIRDGDTARAFSADCPHAGAPLEDGAICNGRIVCPWHKGTFDARDGSLIEPPALKALTRYPVTIKDGEVFVSLEPEQSRMPEARPKLDGRTMLIVGAGAAGAAACASLREAGFRGRILLTGNDAYAPYDRTSLSKFVLSDEMPVDEIPPLLDDGFFEKHAIERVESNAMHLDATNRRVELINANKYEYDAALICTGGVPKPLTMPGAGLSHVHLLRRRDDARTILETLGAVGQHARAVIVGASFIGLEVASSLRKRGIEVSVVAPGSTPFLKQFGERIAEMFKRLHEKNGVRFHMNARVSALHGDDAVREVMLDSGERLHADIVIAGTGVDPATSFLTGVALDEDGGLAVDATMLAAPGLYAAGDIARFTLPGTNEPLRIEHWRVAQQLARVAAFNMAGVAREFDGVPYFWTYHYDKTFEYLGHVVEPDQVECDGELDAQRFIAYLLKDGFVRAVAACEREREMAVLAEVMREPLTLEQARGLVAAA
jgi:apoptosis-inducing factor 3